MSYRAAIIGCGGIAHCHAQAYINEPRMELVAGADPCPEARARFAGRFDVPLYATAEEMLARERPDVVSVCTLHAAHHATVLTAARAGVRAILCEKPLAMDLTQADEMLAACRERGTLLIVGHQRRFQPVYLTIAEPIRAGALGRLTHIDWEMPYWDLMSWGTHAIDMIRFCNHDSPAVSVFGQVDLSTTHDRFGHKVEDSYLARIQFENGVAATITSGPIVKLFHQRVLGEEGEAYWEEIWGDPPRYTIRLRRHGDAAWQEIARPENDGWQTGFDGEVRALADSLETGAPHTLDAASARETLAILMAIYESSRRRRVVHFPVDIPDNPLFAMLADKEE